MTAWRGHRRIVPKQGRCSMKAMLSRPLFAPVLAAFLFCSACSGAPPGPLALPAPIGATTLGPGDVFDLHIVGEDKLPTTFTVAPDGSVDLPYVQRIQAAGLEPQELATAVRQRLMEQQILTNPGV